MKLLDLFCCAGGSAKGYHDAGFDEIVGIDIVKRKNYPYGFIQADVMEILDDEDFIKKFDFIHASPPCQFYSRLKYLSGNVEAWEENHVDLVSPVRNKLEYYYKKYDIPYIIENVEGAPLDNPIKLYGSQFGLLTQRPRLFESCIDLVEPTQKRFNLNTGKLGTISEDGTVSVCGRRNLQGFNEVQTKLYYGIALGGIDWMTLEELTQCIPPCYTEFLGKQVISYFKMRELDKINNTFDINVFIDKVKIYL